MKKIVLYLILTIFSSKIIAQNWQGKVTYNEIINQKKNTDLGVNNISVNIPRDSIGFSNILFFNNTNSYYVSDSNLINGKPNDNNLDSLLKNSKKIVSGKSISFSIKINPFTDDVGEVFAMDFEKKNLEMRRLVREKGFMSSEPIPAIKWQLLNEEKYFGSLKCQKATANFRGRAYIVWFCPEIPISAGPWKLQGLPGLILDARDTDNDIQFNFESIEIPLKQQVKTTPLKNATGKWIPFDEFKHIWLTENEKANKISNSMRPKGDLGFVKSFENPIETSYE